MPSWLVSVILQNARFAFSRELRPKLQNPVVASDFLIEARHWLSQESTCEIHRDFKCL